MLRQPLFKETGATPPGVDGVLWWHQWHFCWRINYKTWRLRACDVMNVQIVWRKCVLLIVARTLTMMSDRDYRAVHGKQQHDLRTGLGTTMPARDSLDCEQSPPILVDARCGWRRGPAERQWFGVGFEMPPLPTKRWTTFWRDVPGSASDVSTSATRAAVSRDVWGGAYRRVRWRD